MNVRRRILVVSCVCLASGGLFAGTVFERREAGTIWQDGLFLGDGATAALAYAPQHLEWVINRNDLFDARHADCAYTPHAEVMSVVATNGGAGVTFLAKELKTRTGTDGSSRTMSAAILRMKFWNGAGWFLPSIPLASQRVDTRTGELETMLDSMEIKTRLVQLIERRRDVMAFGLKDGLVTNRPVKVELARPEDHRLSVGSLAWTKTDGILSFRQKCPDGGSYAVAVSVPWGGTTWTGGRTGGFSFQGDATLFLAVRTSREVKDPESAARAAVAAAVADGFAEVQADNRAWWRNFWEKGARAEFTSEPAVDTQWNYALYALAAQFGRAPMPALNGLVYGPVDETDPGVVCNLYVHDQNAQIPMMPFFPLNHADFVRTFVETYERALPNVEAHTRRLYGVDGACLGLNMSQDGFETPIGDYRYTLCGGAYSGLVLAQAWRYSRDERLLRRMYPLLKRFILFYTETMTRGADGTCHFIWSVPPEIYVGTHDETALIACLKPCLETAVEASVRFGTDERERALWQDILAHYPKIARRPEGGWWCGPEIDLKHYMYGGHLFYPFFPAESDTDPETARRTLDWTWKSGCEISGLSGEPQPCHDWSALYTGMATIRLYGGERGWKALTDFRDRFAKPNGLFSHNPVVISDLTREKAIDNARRLGRGLAGSADYTSNPRAKQLVAPVIEGGATFLLLASDALVQGWSGEVKLFPSVPKGFTGRFENFRLKDGRTVSAEMKSGQVVWSKIN